MTIGNEVGARQGRAEDGSFIPAIISINQSDCSQQAKEQPPVFPGHVQGAQRSGPQWCGLTWNRTLDVWVQAKITDLPFPVELKLA